MPSSGTRAEQTMRERHQEDHSIMAPQIAPGASQAFLGSFMGYFVLNIDPILVRIGALAIHWYGLMYVVAIAVALWTILRYTRRLGLHDDQVWSVFIWTAIAGLIGGRLYFVIQQPNLIQNYLLNPINIIAVWNGGMAFFGAIFAGSATLFLLAPRYGIDRYIAIDGGALFAAVGQIFGRVGNIINGDILGTVASNGVVSIPGEVCAHAPCLAYVPDAHILPWSVVYLNPNSFAATGIAYQPAPVYEILLNLVILGILFPLRFYLPQLKAGVFFVLYLALYALSQFVVFFARGTEPIVSFLGTHVLKQAQWTAVIVLLLCVPLYFFIMRVSRPWPYSAEHPVPWMPATTGHAAHGGAGGSGGSGGERGRIAETVDSGGLALSEVALPAWQPTRAVGGSLRNVFGSGGRDRLV
jgi:phosphatidylglycerol---prolipoprotein diacylglyceryl transferase